MNQILMRGADINYSNSKGYTPLHIAIINKMPVSIIKLMIKSGANPHMCDNKGFDCCDKAEDNEEYMKIKVFKN